MFCSSFGNVNSISGKQINSTVLYRPVVTASTVVQDHMKDNPNFSGVPAPPVDMPALKAATDLLVAKIAAAAEGGKTVIAEKNQQKEVVVKLLVQLAHYVEANCEDDMTIFLSSGFTP